MGELTEDHPDISEQSQEAIRRYLAGESVQLSEDEHRIAIERLERLQQQPHPSNDHSDQEALTA